MNDCQVCSQVKGGDEIMITGTTEQRSYSTWPKMSSSSGESSGSDPDDIDGNIQVTNLDPDPADPDDGPSKPSDLLSGGASVDTQALREAVQGEVQKVKEAWKGCSNVS